MNESIRKCLLNTALAVPPILFLKDRLYSLYRVNGPSMEPALHHGDVLLVRKSDLHPSSLWEKWTSDTAASPEEEEESRNARRVMAMDASSGRSIGDGWTGRTYLHPPTVHAPGSVVVFRAPDAAEFPSGELRVKRVCGLGGQVVRVGGAHRRIERVPPFALWLEGDNHGTDGPSDDGDGSAAASSRCRSVDSRTYGAVCKNSVIGIAERIVWPPWRWGAIDCSTPSVPRSWWQFDT